MLLTITLTRPPATDLGYLLHKHPARAQTFDLSFGKAHVFYTEVSDERCTAALLLDVDPVALARGDRRSLQHYVNDRPYVCSSFLSTAISRVLGSALGGRSNERPDAAAEPLPLEAVLSVVPCRDGEDLIHRMFEPLGYTIHARHYPLDEQFPDWGTSPYFTLRLSATVRLADLLSHLYVLIPVLDRDKHYWINDDEVDKLIRHGEGWLAAHPERDAIVNRYLKYRPMLARDALAQLVDESADPDADAAAKDEEEQLVEQGLRLHDERINAVVAVLKELAAKRVLDLGCGAGRLLRDLVGDQAFTEVVGVDVSVRALERAQRSLKLDRLAPSVRDRVRLLQGSLMYRDDRLRGFDAAAVVEVVEHLEPHRLRAFENAVFAAAKPAAVIVTTPNVEYNVRFAGLPAGSLRHRDHRFEWTREEFRVWAHDVADRYGYAVRFAPIGPEDPEVGPPSQMAVFQR